jgi:hypothetical protein
MSSRRSRSGGDRDPDHVETVEEIGAEAPCTHVGGEVALGGRDDPRAEPARLAAADALVLAVLEHAQEAALQRRFELADLVEEERAAARALEAPDPARDRACERAALVPEQLALEHRRRERCAIGVHEWKLPPRRTGVQRARDETLADAGLAEQEHRRRQRRRALDLVRDPAHRAALAATPIQADQTAPPPDANRAQGQHGDASGLKGARRGECRPMFAKYGRMGVPDASGG